jgi:hypothetical protein
MPVSALLSPQEFLTTPGVSVRLNASSSYDSTGENVAFTWELLSKPVGSLLLSSDLSSAEESDGVVLLTPDQPGTYVVQVTVTNESLESETASSTVSCQYVLGFTQEPTTPDAAWLYEVVGDFWGLVRSTEVFSSLWSGYTQVVGTDISRAYQASQSKSLSTIKKYYERRWLPYFPHYDLRGREFEVVLGPVQGGLGARTTDDSQEATAVVISHQEVVLIGVAASDRAVGQDLVIGSGGSAGSYRILRQNSDSSGYVVRRNSLDPAADVVVSGTDLWGVRTSSVLTSLSVDFAAAGVVAGDVLKLVAGADSDYYVVTAVGLAGGLSSDNKIDIGTAPIRNRTGMSFSVLRPVSVSVDYPGTAYATKVFLPASEADLNVYESGTVTGTATVTSAYEIIVSPRHVFDSMVGREIQITGGADAGVLFTVGAVNSARNGYVLTTAMSAAINATQTYSLLLPYSLTDRLIHVGGVTVPIVAVSLVGTEWVVTVPKNSVPAGLVDATWYIGNTCVVSGVDIEEEGASVGDLIEFSVQDVRSNYEALLPCAVLGAYGNKVMFSVGRTLPVLSSGAPAAYGLSQEEIYNFFNDLQIPSATYDVDTDTVELGRIAADVYGAALSTAFSASNFNLPLSDETIVRVDVSAFTPRIQGLWRNSKIKVDDDLVGVPALFEYIRAPSVDEVEGGFQVVAADGSLLVRDTTPSVLQQNDEFVVHSTGAFAGSNASVVAGSDILNLPSEALVSYGLLPLDTVSLRLSGTYETFVVTEILSETSIRVRPTVGSALVFATTATGLRYKLSRRNTANYLQFVPGTFVGAAAAPKQLWAEISLFDNSPLIEDNFGALVGITKDELDEFGTSQADYLTVVRGLAYGLTNGPTEENMVTAANLLLGAAVSASDGLIVDIDDDFSETQGRVTIQDIDSAGSPTAKYRTYLYYRVGYGAPEFSGIATNPATGLTLAVGDVVLAYQSLTNAVQISDYVSDPYWWSRYGTLSNREIEKYHTWELVVDLRQLPGEDIALVSRFVDDARPIYTRPALVGLLYLSDTVTVETDISFDGTLLLFDDPAFSVESTHMTDDYDGGSVALRAADTGAFSSRTLFRGRDLVTPNGDGSGELLVTSARGGFVDPLTSPLNEYFGPIETRGSAFVKAADDTVKYPGDVLVILSGSNTGSYEIREVVDDTTLRIRQLDTFYFSTYSPESPSPDTVLAGEAQEFVIQRADGPLIWFGVGEATAGSQNIVATGGNFIVNRVAPGDRLLIVDPSGAPYEDVVVAVTRSAVGTQESDTIVAEKESTASGSVEVYVYREALLQNPLLVSNIAATAAGTSVITGLQHAGSFIRKGDVVEIVNSPVPSDVGKTFEIAGIPSPADIIVKLGGGSLGTAVGVTIRVTRPALDAAAADSDTALEVLWTGEYAELDVMRPMTVLFTGIVDAVVDMATRTVTSASSDFVAGGVTPGMRVELQSAARNAGVYVIESVGVTDLTLEVPPNDDEAPAPLLTVLAPAVEFIVDPTGVVTTVSSYHLRGDLANDPFVASVEPGDIFEYDDMIQIMISEVSDYSFRLSRTPPVIGTFAGRIFRTEQT